MHYVFFLKPMFPLACNATNYNIIVIIIKLLKMTTTSDDSFSVIHIQIRSLCTKSKHGKVERGIRDSI